MQSLQCLYSSNQKIQSMTNLHIFTYNNHQITFDFGTNHKMINATEMARAFGGKLPSDFLRLKQTKAFIHALKARYGNSHNEKIINVYQGGRYQGTWMCERLALKS